MLQNAIDKNLFFILFLIIYSVSGCNFISETDNQYLTDSLKNNILTDSSQSVVSNTKPQSTVKNINKKRKSVKDIIVKDVAKQSFNISVESDTIITAKQGTKIFIPSGCFVFSNGKTPKETVKIELKEYYSISDIVLANLSTTSDGKILETGGMIKISAKSNGKKLKINPRKEIKYLFPKNGRTSKMKLFYGNKNKNNIINWKQSNKKKKPKKKDINLIGYNIEISRDRIIYGKVNEVLELVEIESVVLFPSKAKPLVSNYPVIEYFKENLDWSDENKSLFVDKKKLKYSFQVNSSGIISINTEQGLSAEFDEYFAKVLKKFTAQDKKTWKKENKYTIYLRPMQKNKTQDTNIPIRADLDKHYVKYSILSATKLGWINCDKFINIQDDNITMSFPLGDYHENYSLIFKEMKSVLRGIKDTEKNKVIFNNIPKNSDVYLFVSRFVDDQLQFDIINGKAYEIQNIDIEYKESTIKEIKVALNDL